MRLPKLVEEADFDKTLGGRQIMNRKFLSTTLLLALTLMLAGIANADQITIGPSVTNDNVIFKNTAGVTTLGFAGSASAGGTKLAGTASYPNTSPFFGPYTFTFTTPARPTLSLVSPFSYTVTTAPNSIFLNVCIITCANEVQGWVDIQQLSTFNARAPQVSGMIDVTFASGILFNDFAVGPGGQVAFDVNLVNINPTRGVDWVFAHAGQSVQGPLSSGEVIGVPTPEPGTLALFGTGILGLAGLIRRKL
jgi:hypothetical protein